jgi:hypothetical protein
MRDTILAINSFFVKGECSGGKLLSSVTNASFGGSYIITLAGNLEEKGSA